MFAYYSLWRTIVQVRTLRVMRKMSEQSPEEALEESLRRMFAGAVVDCRRRCAVSQERLAELTGLSTSYVSLIERGQRNLTVLTAAKIAAAFGLKLSEFVSYAEANHALT